MQSYEISFYCWTEIITAEEATTDYGALLDMLIDKLEKEHGRYSTLFVEYKDTVEGGGEIYEDEYVTGGNHGLNLFTGGNLNIVSLDPENVYYTTYDGTEKTEPNEPDTRSITEWKKWFTQYGDKEEYYNFDEWIMDMISSGVLLVENTVTMDH